MVRTIITLASIGTIVLWCLLNFFNPYAEPANELLLRTFIFLFVPACLALTATYVKKPLLMIIASVWSLPISLYLLMTPSIFALFGVTSILYLVGGILAIRENKSRKAA